MLRPPISAGYTLIELCLLLVLFALLSALAVPSFSKTLGQGRARAALDRLSADLFLARALAARDGRPLLIRFDPPAGCADHYEIVRDSGEPLRRVTTRPRESGVCLRSNVPAAMRVNARGMLTGSSRKFYVTSGRAVDSATVSIVGRVLRWR